MSRIIDDMDECRLIVEIFTLVMLGVWGSFPASDFC